MRPTPLMLSAGFALLILAYLSPLITDPVQQRAAWALGAGLVFVTVEGWRRSRVYHPGDYA